MFNHLIPLYVGHLTNLKAILEKAKGFQEAHKISDEAICGARLALDQFPLIKQVQLVSDYAKRSGAILCGVQNPSFEDNEKTLTELQQRIDKTLAFLATLTEAMEQKNLESQIIPLPWMPGKGLSGKYYIEVYGLSNIYFHYTTAYSILRHYGLAIGKGDYMGNVELKDLQ